jgi:hypothetical protein
MKSLTFKLFFLSYLLFTLSSILTAQTITEYDFNKESILHSNNITSVIFNYGSIGKPNYLGNVADMVWGKLGYMFEFGPMIAGEVISPNGDTLHIVSDSYILPGQGDYSPDGLIKWGWKPREGYSNPSQQFLATRNNPLSWPDEWQNIWPGEFGQGVPFGLDEAYYVMDDFSNSEFPYYPFPSDTTKRGLGIKAEVRIFQMGSGLKDALVIKYKITNESPLPLNKLYFGFMGDPHIGGASDYGDDRIGYIPHYGIPNAPQYNLARNTIYSYDSDMKGTGGKPTGYMGLKFLKTPNQFDLTSLKPLPYTNSLPNVPKNDQLMWQIFNGGIDSTSEFYSNAGDYVMVFGTGPFSLQPGQSEEVVFTIFFAWNFDEMLNRAVYSAFHYNWNIMSDLPGSSGGNENYKISLSSPNSGIINGDVPIQWNYQGTDPNAQIFIEYSSDKGRTWFPLVWDLSVSENYLWNTENQLDGVNYLLRAIAYNPNFKNQYYFDVTDNRFTINNSTNAKPEIEFVTNFDSLNITVSWFDFSFLAEDADNSSLNINLEYAHDINGPFFTLIENGNYSTGVINYISHLSNLPNSDSYYLRLTASDGFSDSTILSEKFAINEEKGIYQTSLVNQISGNSTPDFNFIVVDTSAINYSQYKVSFNISGESKNFSIKNMESNTYSIIDYPLLPNLTTPSFDGLKMSIKDQVTRINEEQTFFNNSSLNSSFSFIPVSIGNPKTPAAEDWIITFTSFDTLSNGSYVQPGDTSRNQSNVATICPFKILTYPALEKATYLINERTAATRNNGKWDLSETIVLRPTNASGTITSYELKFDFLQGLFPTINDTLFIKTYKQITAADTFIFTPDRSFILGFGTRNLIEGYSLSQNYPNPFNPITTINYSIPQNGLVSIKVYDILGREVITLVNEEQKVGRHSIEFDGRRLSSGIYLYKIQAGEFLQTKKMLLIK